MCQVVCLRSARNRRWASKSRDVTESSGWRDDVRCASRDRRLCCRRHNDESGGAIGSHSTVRMDMRSSRRRRCVRRVDRWSIGAAVAALATATTVVVPLGTASGSPCDGPSCVPHLRTGAVQGAPCEAARLYPFGLDASGNTLICYATYRNPTTASWSPVPKLVGIRDYGALCSDHAVAQSPDGLPLVCRGSIWDRYTPDLPVS